MNLKSKTTGFALFLTIVIGFTVIMTATAPSSQGPYVDEQWFRIIKSPDAQLIALATHEIDCGGVPLPEYIHLLQATGMTITSTEKLGYEMLFMNNLVYPCNVRTIREAMTRLVDKAALDELCYPMRRHMEYWLPESQAMWVNRGAKLPMYNPGRANGILNAAGYKYSTVPTPAGWYDPDVPGSQPFYRLDPTTGLPMRPFEYVTRPYAESPLYYEQSMIVNDKFHAMGIPSMLTPKTWEDIVHILTNAAPNDYELLSGIGVVWGSPAPDVMYAFFESGQTPLWNLWNFVDPVMAASVPGITPHYFGETRMDYWCHEMRATLVPATLTTAVNNIQSIANSEIPYVPLMEYLTYDALTGPYDTSEGSIKIVNMKGVGATGTCPSDALAFGTLPITNEWGKEYGECDREEGGKNLYKHYLGVELDTLNPLMANTVPDWATLDLLTGDFVRLNPYTWEYMWRVTTGMPTTAPWAYTPFGKWTGSGMTLTYTLRPGVTWHDGTPVTVADCVFALNLMRFQGNDRYRYVWEPIWDVVATGPSSFTIWWLDRYLFAHEYFGISLLAPSGIWMPYILPTIVPTGPMGGDRWTGWVRHHSTFEPWEVAHPTVPGLTCLIGTDNFVYRDAGWDPGISVCVEAWDNVLNYMPQINPGDCTLDGIVDMYDVWQVFYRQGVFTGQCYPTAIGGHPRWDPIADIAYPAQRITGDELVLVLSNFGQTWGP